MLAAEQEKLFCDPKPINPEVAKKVTTLITSGHASPGWVLAARLIAYNAYLQGESPTQPYSFDSDWYLRKEHQARSNPLVPTIGVEIEVPKVTEELSPRAAILSTALAVPYSNLANHYEFSLPYSYSWRTQMLILRNLFELQYIPYQQNSKGQKSKFELPNQRDFSVHCNLGIPADFDPISLKDRAGFLDDSMLLARSLGLGFSTPERLKTRKTSSSATTEKENTASDKSPDRRVGGRVELRPLGFSGVDSFRQLAVAQNIGACLFPYFKLKYGVPTTAKEEELALIWERARRELDDLSRGRLWEVFDQRKMELYYLLQKNPFREKFRQALSDFNYQAYCVINS